MKITSTEARKRWADVLDAVNRAENVVLTRRGKPYAVVMKWRERTTHDEPWRGHCALMLPAGTPDHLAAACIGLPLFKNVEPMLENLIGKCVAATTDVDGRMWLRSVTLPDVNIPSGRGVSYAADSLGRVVYLYIAPALPDVLK